jgi:enoyl-CoA hydratase/carnithine racemase
LLPGSFFHLEKHDDASVLRLWSEDGTNRLTRACLLALIDAMNQLAEQSRPLVITGNESFFSAGAELAEIAALDAPAAYEFSRRGHALMLAVQRFPAPVHAAVSGYCLGGGLDLALACHRRFAASNAVFGHRGAALGLITGWGGTQRLPRLVGNSVALEMFVAAEKINAHRALEIGLVDAVVSNPVAEAVRRLRLLTAPNALENRRSES